MLYSQFLRELILFHGALWELTGGWELTETVGESGEAHWLSEAQKIFTGVHCSSNISWNFLRILGNFWASWALKRVTYSAVHNCYWASPGLISLRASRILNWTLPGLPTSFFHIALISDLNIEGLGSESPGTQPGIQNTHSREGIHSDAQSVCFSSLELSSVRQDKLKIVSDTQKRHRESFK